MGSNEIYKSLLKSGACAMGSLYTKQHSSHVYKQRKSECVD